jgi:hypothetical protein
MDASTRPPHIRHQGLARVAPALVAALFLSVSGVKASTERPINSTTRAPTLVRPASGEMAITTVPKGQEGLELSARFTEDGRTLVDNIAWKISDQDQALVYDKTTARAAVLLPPGQYQIEASFGTAHLQETVNLQAGTKLGVTMVMNAGALRILPRVKGVAEYSVASTSNVFALNGIERGKLVATSSSPGEVLNVPAGDYRVESKFTSGNAVAVTDVHIRAGYTSAINIDHIAGVVKLMRTNAEALSTEWTVTDTKGQTITSTMADFILKPGHYLASGKLNGRLIKAEFDIVAGQTQEIQLQH